MTTLDDLITRANNVLGALEGLIQGDAAETPLVDTSVSYTLPAIAYDETNSAWTLSQTTADTIDGLYKGLFTLALETGCAYLTVVSHNVVTPDDNVPARYLACGGITLTDVAAMTTLNNKQITQLEIRSKQPFSVTISLTQSWCRSFDFTLSDGGWSALNEISGAEGHWGGSAWVSDVNGGSLFVSIGLTFQPTTVTKITLNYSTNGSANGGFRGIQINGAIVAQNIGNGGQYAWTGSVINATSIYLKVHTSNNNAGSNTITSVTIEGSGVNPFATSNCQ